jgi:ribosomal protein S18 acetylase RimI-like enzyme
MIIRMDRRLIRDPWGETHTVNIHPAHHSHADVIAELSHTQIEYGLSWSWTADRVKRAIRDPDTNVVVATKDENLVSALQGFGIMRYRDDRAHLMLLAVVPEARSQGLGKLIQWARNYQSKPNAS